MNAVLPPGPAAPRALQTLRWIVRPGAMLEDCRRRYGDMFTLRIAHEGTWVFLAHPDAIKQVFTSDPRLLHAGEANVVLLPMLGHHSVLLLDEGAHMSQRKLMLPSFHGERLAHYREQMESVALAELGRWPLGRPVAARPHTQAITLDVIVRTVFGIEEGERMTRLRAALRDLLEWTTARRRLFVVAMFGPDRLKRDDRLGFTRVLAAADELVF